MMDNTPDPNDIAELLDGTLPESERGALLRRIVDDPDSYAQLVQAIRASRVDGEVDHAIDTGDARIVPIPSRSRVRAWMPAAAAAAIAALLVVPRLADRSHAFELIDPAAIAATISGTNWAASGWEVRGGTAAGVSAETRAFRLGVRLVDLDVAHELHDLNRLRVDGAELIALTRELPGGSALAVRQQRWIAQAANAATRETQAALADFRETIYDLTNESPWHELGLWVEQSRLAAHAGMDEYFRADSDAIRQLRWIVERIEASNSNAPEAIARAGAIEQYFESTYAARDAAVMLDSLVAELGSGIR